MRPIRAITVTSAGGTSDIFMRALADEMHKGLGQPIVIENRPGGSFNIGARACAEAAPDGYSVCILPGEPLAFNQFLFPLILRRSSRSPSFSPSCRRWWSANRSTSTRCPIC